jgi:hypothetical protein
LVIVPALLIAAVEKVTEPAPPPDLAILKLLFPVTPPVKVVVVPVPVLPIVRTPVVSDASIIAFE